MYANRAQVPREVTKGHCHQSLQKPEEWKRILKEAVTS